LRSNIEGGHVVLEVMDVELIKQQLEGYTLSVTHLNKYLNCPISFYFENILRVPSSRNSYSGFGSAAHLALQSYYEKMLEDPDKQLPSKEVLMYAFERGMEKYHSHFTAEQYTNMLEHGKQVLAANYDQNIEDWNKNSKDIVVEQRLENIEIEGVPVNGMIDKLEKYEGDKVRVIDYKTGKPESGRKKLKGPDDKEPNGGDYWRQMVFYKLLLDNNIKHTYKYEEGCFEFLEPDDKNIFHTYKVVVSPLDEAIVKGQIKEVYKNILDLKFDTGCGKDDCNWCTFVKENYKEGELSILKGEEEE
jgi:DNA helicase II / ATP-dependent DNA helicase PcrA